MTEENHVKEIKEQLRIEPQIELPKDLKAEIRAWKKAVWNVK
ncbi:MAG: hypothetical protein ACYSUX_00335 [Planctomycetota bacterium]|jgi:hypothetical protein